MEIKKAFEDMENEIVKLESKISNNDSFLRMLFDTIPNPLFYKDKNGVYLHCNEAFSKTILGVSKEQILGKTLYELSEVIPRKLADIYYEKDNELFSNPGTQVYKAQVKCANGELRDFQFYKSTFMIDGKAEGLVGIMLDITEHNQLLNELNEKNEKLKDTSKTDFLTNMYNRRYFEEIFEKKLSLLDRHNHKFSFALVDIDFFKDYNDSYGHQAGDEVLKQVSIIIKDTFHRPNDYAFRIGGEEFAILFDVEKNEDAFELIEILRKNIENAKIETWNNKVSDYITVSIGLGNINKVESGNENTKFLYDKVDKLLYLSKGRGRNQTSMKNFD